MMNTKKIGVGALLGLTYTMGVIAQQHPNVIVIMTDEHVFRTLGCYRETLPDSLAYPWGPGIAVKTPNLDKIAKQGAIYTRYYASSPVSSPSRASFFTGRYPNEVGVPLNGCGLRHDAVTFGKVLKDHGYSTSYVGKWHLADDIPMPGWNPTPTFGFDYTQYMFNSYHQKWYQLSPDGDQKKIIRHNSYNPKAGEKWIPATRFLTDRALEVLERDKDKPFCLVLNIPDPHSPDIAIPPYDKMFTHFKFQHPVTMDQNVENRPKWALGELDNEMTDFNAEKLANYFGMVADVDNQVGRVLAFLKKNKLEKNTIILFTADHGELNYEHHRINKGLPFESSARIPYVIRYPKVIRAGKVIATPSVNVNFAPTLLGLMGFPNELHEAQGIDESDELRSKALKVKSKRTIYETSTFSWTMATDGRYKLVVSTIDKPWLFDLQKDPYELINFYNDSAYRETSKQMKQEMIHLMKKYKEPRLNWYNKLQLEDPE